MEKKHFFKNIDFARPQELESLVDYQEGRKEGW